MSTQSGDGDVDPGDAGVGQQGGSQIGAEERDEGGRVEMARGKQKLAASAKPSGAQKTRFKPKAAAPGDFFTRIGKFRPSVSTSFPLSCGAWPTTNKNLPPRMSLLESFESSLLPLW